MKTIQQDDLYQNLNDFLKSKGVNLTEGTYSERIRKSCGLLTDVINATQNTVSRAKSEVDKKLDQLRQSIHEATAPNPPPSASTPPPTAPASSPPQSSPPPSSPPPSPKPKASAARPKPAKSKSAPDAKKRPPAPVRKTSARRSK